MYFVVIKVRFYFALGADIVRMEKDRPWGSGSLKRLSLDLKMRMPEANCFSPRNLKYMRFFYKLYALSMCPDIEFRRYKVDFKLLKD